VLIKSADDKSKRLRLLEDLEKSPLLDGSQKDWLAKQLRNMRTGIAGEKDAAHYIDTHYRDRDTHAVIHDLRIEIDGEVAQIDHLVISRGMHFYLLESKSFNGDLVVNEHGEFSVRYGMGAFYGIPSPLEQGRRQAKVLQRLLARLEISGRIGTELPFHTLVLVHPRSNIRRPKAFDTSHVIKADAFATWHEKFQNKMSVSEVFSSALQFRSLQTLKELAEKIVRQHRPPNALALPDFMAPNVQGQTPPPAMPTPSAASQADKRLICSTCAARISFAEGRFCWNNEKRFGGRQYCREHQRPFS
jgi:hypothetical protein